jgi:hypothetical protein
MAFARKKIGDGMSNRRQIKFEAPEEFYDKLQSEKLKRGLLIQDIAIRAIERYFAVTEETHKEIDAHAERLNLSIAQVFGPALAHHLMRLRKMDPKSLQEMREIMVSGPSPELKAFLQQMPAVLDLYEFVRQFPPEKTKLLRDMLALDLKYYRSARIKDHPQEGAENDTDEQS